MSSAISLLRQIAPVRPLGLTEALRIAERQADRLLQISGTTDPPMPETVVSNLPRVQVERLRGIPVSGSAHWANSRWVIVLNGAEPLVRQRFSLAHELKHVIDAPGMDYLYHGHDAIDAHQIAEYVADQFAASLLMPRTWVTTAWTSGVQDIRTLAHRFGVSHHAMRIRLHTLGLTNPEDTYQAA